MSVLIRGLNIKPCEDGFGGKGLVIIGYDDKLYAVAHEQIIPLPDHGDLIDRDALFDDNLWNWFNEWGSTVNKQAQLVVNAPVVIPAERSEDGET